MAQVHEEVRERFREMIRDVYGGLPEKTLSEEEIGIFHDGVNDLADRMANIAQAYYDVPDGIVEIRCDLSKYTIENGKEISLTMKAYNSPEIRKKLAMLDGNAITLRGLQADIEAMTPKPADTSVEAEEAPAQDENPDQMDLEEFTGDEPRYESDPQAMADAAAADDDDTGYIDRTEEFEAMDAGQPVGEPVTA